MADEPVHMSPVKLGLTVAWWTFWTGFPIKIVFVLVLLAGGLHPWESTGLALLLLLSIPVDIWATGVNARTVFLERLRVQPPGGLGLAIWWKGLILQALYCPMAYFALGWVKDTVKESVHSLFDMEMFKSIPVAERITIELTMWGSVAAVALVIFAVIFLSIFGRIIRREAAGAAGAVQPYSALVREWDLMRVPSDQPLLLTAVTGSCVATVLLFWSLIPSTTPHPHELYKKEPPKAVATIKPLDVLQKTDKLLGQADLAVQGLEEKKAEEEAAKGKSKGKPGVAGKAPGGAAVSAKNESPKAAQAKP